MVLIETIVAHTIYLRALSRRANSHRTLSSFRSLRNVVQCLPRPRYTNPMTMICNPVQSSGVHTQSNLEVYHNRGIQGPLTEFRIEATQVF
jgi:hypothetical protein